MQLSLDLEGRHTVCCEPLGASRARLTLAHDRGDRGSPLHAALRGVVRVACGDTTHAFPSGADTIEVAHDGAVEVCLGRPGRALCRFVASGSAFVARVAYQLSVFECRYLAEYGRVYPVPETAPPPPATTTDLHAHYAGCVHADALVALGAQRGVSYPPALLAEAGIRVDGAEGVLVSDLSPAIRSTLAVKLEVPSDRRMTFLDMERIYRLRSPLTKHPAMFVPLLRRIAEDYAAMGVTYAELSLGDVARAHRLRAVHEHVPAIEADTGVTLRFLVAMSRHDDVEWDLDVIERLAQVAGSRYIVGVDFMGHETNSTHAFATQLRAVSAWASRARRGFVIRVHAGENPAHPENVRAAAECTVGDDVMLRIGHGLYGVDDETLDVLAERGAVVEFNLNSNFALNNIQALGDAPIRRYLRRGVRVVLGSDGYGIYRTTPELEARAAWLCGLDEADLARIAAHERDYVAARLEQDSVVVEPGFTVPDDAPFVHYSDAVVARRAGARARRDAALGRAIAETGARTVSRADLLASLDGRSCISLAGAWKHSWNSMAPTEQQAVRAVVEELVGGLDPARTVLFTGGTRYGVEGLAAARAARCGVRHVAVLVASTPCDALASGAIDEAVVVGETLHDKAAALYELMREVDGLCLFIGGGNVVSDEVQCARNLRLRYMLMAGVTGASARHAREQPHRAFRNAREVHQVLAGTSGDRGGGYRYAGENPCVDVVVTRHHPDSRIIELLLVRRDVDAAAEAGVWALPGGFVASDAPRGSAWQAGRETVREAALRELYEETGVDARDLEDLLEEVGAFAGGGRDPRDSDVAWSRTTVYALTLPRDRAAAAIAGGDDASDARWFPVAALPLRLAFDHGDIVRAWRRRSR